MKRFVLIALGLLAVFSAQAQDKWLEPKARLRFVIKEDSINFGNSFDLLLTFEVDDDNKAPIRFYEAGSQLSTFTYQLKQHGYSVSHDINNITARNITGARGVPAVTYDMLKLKIWPSQDGIVRFPSIYMDFLQFQSNPNDTTSDHSQSESKLVTFSTEPALVIVRPEPLNENSKDLPYVGRLSLKEELPQGDFMVGDRIPYKLILSGTTLGMMLTLPAIQTDQLQVIPEMVSFTDSIRTSGSYRFEKTYELTLIPKKEGVIDLSEHFFWKYISTNATHINSQASGKKLFVKGEKSQPDTTPLLADLLLSIDMSESMELEDYKPNRFAKALEVAKAYRELRPGGKITGFAKEVINLSSYEINDIERGLNKTRGTGIFGSLWLGTETLRSDARRKAIIMVCDGDDTTSSVSMSTLLEFLARENVRVYTIGIGHNGKIPFGKDFSGSPQYVDNTFNDATMKYIASETGGQYYYMDDYESAIDIIQAITKDLANK